MEPPGPFQGFSPPTSNTTYTPNQYFDVVLPYASRGVARLVGYMIRKTLGWCDTDGNPQEPQSAITYRELEEDAGIGHSMIRKAIDEAIAGRFITCLRAPQPDALGTRAVSALYALRWDPRQVYITDRTAFDGFFSGNGNLTYIPNDFFDVLLPQESLAVIRVVGSVIRNTIGFQTQFGFRRQKVQMSVTNIEKRTNLSREAVRNALQEALAKNFIQLVEAGVFDPNAAQKSQAATYGIKWRDGFTGVRENPAQPGLLLDTAPLQPESAPKSCTIKDTHTYDRSEKLHGEMEAIDNRPLRKVARNYSEKLHGDHSEKLHGIEITKNNTSLKEQQQSLAQPEVFSAAAVVEENADAISETRQLLLAQGFDEKACDHLIALYPAERIARQCEWITRRQATRNRLGMLRKAIEGNWPEPAASAPESSAEPPVITPGAQFAAHFYAGWAGNPDTPLAPPSANDIRAAEPFVARLLELIPDPAAVCEWGRAFGRMVRDAERDNPRPLRALTVALRHHGDAFFLQFRERSRKAVRQTLTARRQAHEALFQQAYRDYLRIQEADIRETHPAIYATFEAQEQEGRRKYDTGIFANSTTIRATMLASYDRDEDHLERFRAFFQRAETPCVYSFWEWDARVNPESLGRNAADQ